MSMSKYVSYLGKVYVGLKDAQKKSGLSIFFLWFDFLWCALRYGTRIKQYVYSNYWGLSHVARNEGLTYRRMERLIDKYNLFEYWDILHVKQKFNVFYKDFIHHDWRYVNEISYDEFAIFLRKYDSIFIKPTLGEDGEGIRKFTLSSCPDEDLEALFQKLIGEKAIIEECIIQHPSMAFGTKSVNTIKVTTVMNSLGEPRIIKSMLRIGIGDSVIDNLATGGAIYDIDIEKGIVSSYGYSKYGDKLIFHPGTELVILGFKIPHWERVKECAINAAKMLPQDRIIGWDIAITPDGVDLIEGNHNPDYLPIEYGTTGFYKKIKNALK